MTTVAPVPPTNAELDVSVRELQELAGDLHGTVEQLQADVLRLQATPPQTGPGRAGPATPAATAASTPGALVYASVDVWVRDYFAQVFIRRSNNFRWCAEWWRHPEALIRLEALWRTWEHKHCDPVDGLSTWLRVDLGPALAVLGDVEGPFGKCDPDMHSDARTAPMAARPAPRGWIPDLRA